MSAPARRREECRVTLRCQGADCGAPVEVSARFARQVRKGEYPCLCSDCKRPSVTLAGEEIAFYERWWLERFSLDEIREMGAAIFGGGRNAPAALTASAHDDERP